MNSQNKIYKMMRKEKGNIVLITIIIMLFLIGGGMTYLVIKNLPEKKQPPSVINERESLENENYLENKEESPIVENQEIASPQITFEVKFEGECFSFDFKEETRPSKYAIFNIIRDGKIIGEIESPYCKAEAGQISILAQNKEYVYFTFVPSGIGGYIIFAFYRNLYRLDLKNNKTSQIINESFSGNTFSSNLKKIIYNRLPTIQEQQEQGIIFQEIILLDLINKNLIRKYDYPTEYFNFDEQWQFGHFKFSPNEDKVAFVGVRGPADEKGGVYILSLENGIFRLVEEKNDYIFRIEGWLDNETVIYK